MKDFRRRITKLFKPKGRPAKLIPHQTYLLDSPQSSQNLLVLRTDKNLVPAVYHLSNADTYQSLTIQEANVAIIELTDLLTDFIDIHHHKLGAETRKIFDQQHARSD
jgi:hypothetical protein